MAARTPIPKRKRKDALGGTAESLLNDADSYDKAAKLGRMTPSERKYTKIAADDNRATVANAKKQSNWYPGKGPK